MKGIVENRSLKKGLLQEVRQFFKVNVAAQPFIILGRIKLSFHSLKGVHFFSELFMKGEEKRSVIGEKRSQMALLPAASRSLHICKFSLSNPSKIDNSLRCCCYISVE